VGAVLHSIADLASGGRPGLALTLIEEAIDRIEEAVEEVDDSDGHCGELLDEVRSIHLKVAIAAHPEPVQFARDLFAREMGVGSDTFHGAVAAYADVLGADGLAEYRRLATDAWEKLPPRSGHPGERHSLGDGYGELKVILDFFADREGDLETRIALRAKDLSSSWSYLDLAEFCLAHGREEEALRRAEEGLRRFENERPDERMVFFAVGLLEKAGRKEDAEAYLRRAFEKAPGFELYARLRAVGGSAARERAIAFLEARLSEKPTQWHHPADLLIRVRIEEKSFDAAWATLGRHGASTDVKEALARASEATHPRQALEIYAARVDQLVDSGSNRSYEQAARLVAHIAGLWSAAEQAAYVTVVKRRFGRKRNFMKLLA
jgi:tetratricopeptide (TPR) repeat protein